MKKILYIIDDINYNSGAKAVTVLQMKQLQKDYDIYLLSLAAPKEPLDFLDQSHVLDPCIWKITEIYAASFKQALRNHEYYFWQKCSRILYAFSLRCGLGDMYFEHQIKRKLQPVMEEFDTVIVVSEASKLRRLVSKLEHPKKIQWIHTDYARWSEFSEWSRAVTKNDHKIYPHFDQIVVLSNHCRQGLIEKVPEIANKVIVISNLIDTDNILNLAKEDRAVILNTDSLNLVTVARIDREKRIDYLLKIAKKMKEYHWNFQWYVIGDGPLKEVMSEKNKEMNLEGYVHFIGYTENPYAIMAGCDALVLLSKYEGTPVTIDEAMILGIGIIAPPVGGIPEQTEGYENIYLVDAEKIKIEQLMKMKKRQQHFYDFNKRTEKILESIKMIL